MNRWISYALVAVVLSAGAFFYQSSQSRDLPNFGMAEAQTADAADAAEVDKSLVAEMALGAEDAPLTVIEYASFTCPHCRSFHENTFKQVKAEYIDTGKVRFIYREVYFDRFGLWAGMVARCGGAEKYFGISSMIYNQQATWTKGENPGAIADNLVIIGKTAGLTGDEIDACLQNNAMAQAMIAVYQENAETDGINSTPTFIINGQKYSNMPYDEFAVVLDEKLAEE